MDKELLDIICCPKTGEDLEMKGDKLVSKKSGNEYIIKDGIPVLLDERI